MTCPIRPVVDRYRLLRGAARIDELWDAAGRPEASRQFMRWRIEFGDDISTVQRVRNTCLRGPVSEVNIIAAADMAERLARLADEVPSTRDDEMAIVDGGRGGRGPLKPRRQR